MMPSGKSGEAESWGCAWYEYEDNSTANSRVNRLWERQKRCTGQEGNEPNEHEAAAPEALGVSDYFPEDGLETLASAHPQALDGRFTRGTLSFLPATPKYLAEGLRKAL